MGQFNLRATRAITAFQGGLTSFKGPPIRNPALCVCIPDRFSTYCTSWCFVTNVLRSQATRLLVIAMIQLMETDWLSVHTCTVSQTSY